MPQPENSFQMSRITLAAMLAVASFGISAQPVKCVDASGKIRYIDESMAGQEKCKPVSGEMQVVPQQPGAATRQPGASPGINLAEREARVARAEKSLAEVQRQLAAQEAVRSGDEHN